MRRRREPLDPDLVAAARVAVDRRVREIFATIPCFCTPQRPELGREEWCAKHVVIRRLNPDAIAEQIAFDVSRARDSS